MTFDPSVVVTAFLLGLFSSAHCIGMCGGIVGALSMAIPAGEPRRRLIILCCYNLGRLLSYAFMGILVGLFAQQITTAGGTSVLRWLAGLLLIAMGLYLANWWHGLTYLESAGRYLWAYVQPVGKKLMPVNNPVKGVLLGALWGWLPCGLVYSALAYGMAQGNWASSGLTMLAFGAGTLPALLLAGVAAQQLTRLLQLPQLRWSVAILIILFGLWTFWGGIGHGHHHSHHESTPAAGTEVSPHHHHQQASSAADNSGSHEHHHH